MFELSPRELASLSIEKLCPVAALGLGLGLAPAARVRGLGLRLVCAQPRGRGGPVGPEDGPPTPGFRAGIGTTDPVLASSWPRTGLAGEEVRGRQEVGQEWGWPGLSSEPPGARRVLLATWK